MVGSSDPTRRRFIAGIGAVAALPGCGLATDVDAPDGADSGLSLGGDADESTDVGLGGGTEASVGEAEPAAAIEATRLEPSAPWSVGGLVDLGAFACGLQVGDVRPESALCSLRTPETAVELWLAVAVAPTAASDASDPAEVPEAVWARQRVFVHSMPEDGILQFELLELVPDTAYSIVSFSADGRRRGPVCRFRTAIAATGRRVVRFGAVACLRENQPWPSLSHAATERLDFFALLGDTIYADYGPRVGFTEKWRQSLATAGLREVTASTSVVATWDDHEVENNWSWDDAGMEQKAAAAREAFRQAIPQRRGPDGDSIWRQLSWGETLELFVLDCRGERRDGDYISSRQMGWLKDRLSQSTARFKIILNSVPITDFSVFGLLGSMQVGDRWQGYPLQRSDILAHIEDNEIEGVLWLSGDLHIGLLAHVGAANEVGSSAWEVLVGPGGSPVRFKRSMVGGIFDANVERFPLFVDQHNFTLFEADPDAGTVTIGFVGDDGEIIAEQVLSL